MSSVAAAAHVAVVVAAAPKPPTTAIPAATAPDNPFRLPSGTNLLQHQVAGHICEMGKDTIGILKDQQLRTVLKAANKPLCGAREIHFYKRVYDDDDSSDDGAAAVPSNCWSQLRRLTPQYFGTVTLPVADRFVEFLRLQDVTHGMREPCVMDVKIGARTWDPLANAQKMTAEREKYAACKQTLGFCIPGFQVYRTDGGVQRYGKDFGKSLSRHNVRDVLLDFLNADQLGVADATLLRRFRDGVGAILDWSRAQNTLRLFSSSVLLAYDASALRTNGGGGGPDDERAAQLQVQVKMIDFAHAFERDECPDSRTESEDRNYVDGVSNLYALFAELLPNGGLRV